MGVQRDPLMQELAHATFTYEHFPEVMSMLWKRMLQDNKQNWRRTYKSLLLLNYLVRNGSERVVTSAREHIYDLRSLENYSFMDENGKDQGINVRHKVRELIDFIQDDDKVRDERKKAKKNKDKYIGMSSDAMGGRFGGGYSDRYNDSRYDDRNWYSEGTRRDSGNNYEDDYPYDGEKEDSDHETGHNSAKRYYDKERSSPSRTTPTLSASSSISIEVKKQSNPVSVKSPTKQQQPAAKPSKKIDMGAAANFGKNPELGINSPTHKSTHDEDLFSPNNNTVAAATKNNDLLEDLFRTCPVAQSKGGSGGDSLTGAEDDFNPRGEDNQEFGDFASAFGNESAQPPPAAAKKEDEFADFSAAFLGAGPPPAVAAPTNANNLLLTTTPLTSNNFVPSPTMNMFGSAMPAPAAAPPSQDLLSDFSGLQLNTSPLNAPGVGGKSNGGRAEWRKEFEENMRKLIQKLETLERVSCEREEVEITTLLRRILDEIPCGGNIQDLWEEGDGIYWRIFAQDDYSNLLEGLFRVFQGTFNETIKGAFLLHLNANFVMEMLEVLLKGETLRINSNSVGNILGSMMEDEEILWIAFVDQSRKVDGTEENLEENILQKQERQTFVERFIQLLISIPERLANCLQGSVPDILTRHIWSQKLIVRVLLALLTGAEDDFNPRGEDNQEFGDFASAFGSESAQPPSAAAAAKKEDEFADFSAAFLGAGPPPGAAAPTNANNLLLTTTPLTSNNFVPSPTMNMFGSAMPAPAAAPPSQDLLSDFSGLQLNTSPLNAPDVGGKSNGGRAEWRKEFEENMRKLIQKLETLERVSCEREEVEITTLLRRILDEIPCGGNIQDLWEEEDGIYWRIFAQDDYSNLLEGLFRVFQRNFNETIKGAFLLHLNANFVMEMLEVLLKGETLRINSNSVGNILGSMMEDEEILWIAFVDQSRKVDGTEENFEENILQKQERQTSKERFIQLLISIPERLANCLQGSVPDILTRHIWSQKLIVRVLLALYSVGKINLNEQREVFSTQFLAAIFSRIVIDYNFDRTSPALVASVGVLEAIARESSSLKETVVDFLGNLTRNAAEIYAVIIFANSGNAKEILGNEILNIEAWKFALLTKIPLTTITKSSKIAENLINFLGEVSDGKIKRFLQNLLVKICNSWANKATMEHSSLDQHVYLTKFLILSVLRLKGMQGYSLKEDQKFLNGIKKKLNVGIPNHLHAMDGNLRIIGMITAEMTINEIEEVDEEAKLNFEVEKMEKIDKKLVEELRQLRDLSSLERSSSDRASDLAEMIQKIENCGGEIEKIEKKPPKQAPKIEEAKITPKAGSLKEIPDEDDLDSDDDLIPYDMSNDVPETEAYAPKYLLDLQEALNDAENADRFEQSLAVCSDLIYSQLPDNEVQLGLNLLQILINLDEKTYCENFERDRFSGCIAIFCVIPKEAAEHICREFYAKQTNYSVSRRILMLEILGEAAKELSKVQKSPEKKESAKEQPKSEKIIKKFTISEPDALKEAKKVIEERILTKTRRFARKTPITVGAANRFAPVAGSFFWPLLHGFGRNQLAMEAGGKLKQETDAVLLEAFIKTLSVLMISSQNCPGNAKFAAELFALGAVLRFHSDGAVRLAVLQMIGSIFMTLPQDVLKRDFQDYLLELIGWLTERVGNNIAKKDPNEECRALGRHILVFYNVLLPSSNAILQPQNPNAANANDTAITAAATRAGSQVGSTWTNTGSINLDLDNLLVSKRGKGEAAPSMNQLKSQSPVKTMPQSPSGAPIMGGGGSLLSPTQKIPTANIPAFGAFGATTQPKSAAFASPNQFNAFQ
uniref:ENTH domain-containing protein n=1 Tax=Lutzomyia longipalpis TaxID=7200 RepID=A0A1B0C8Y9_LUTLO